LSNINFSFSEDDYAISITISKQQVPISVTQRNFAISFEITCKSNFKFYENQQSILNQTTQCFNIQKPNATKVSFIPVVVKGTAYLITIKNLHADFLEPFNLFRVMLNSFSEATSVPHEELNYYRYFNFSPSFSVSIPDTFEIGADPMGVTFTHKTLQGCSFSCLPIDMVSIRQMLPQIPVAVDNIYDFMRINWQMSQIRFNVESEKENTIGNRKVYDKIISGVFMPGGGTMECTQLTFYNHNNFSVGFLWKAPASEFQKFWNTFGKDIYSSIKC